MKPIFLSLLAAAVALHEPVTVDDIDSAIRWLTRGAPRISTVQRDAGARREMAESIISASQEYNLPPYRVTSVAFHESWFETDLVGKAGEAGAMQVKDAVLKRCQRDGFDLSTARDQVRCGARHLRERIDYCGNVRDGMASYILGPCSDDGIKKKVNSRMMLTRRLASKPWEE